MKRLLILVVAVVSFGATTFASNPSGSFVYKLNDEKTFNRVASYLGVGFEQKDDLYYVFNEGEKRISRATEKGATLEEAIQKAIYFNLANARVILSRDQYIKFVSLINLTINNEKKDELFAEK